jgi:hypothetical protein
VLSLTSALLHFSLFVFFASLILFFLPSTRW